MRVGNDGRSAIRLYKNIDCTLNAFSTNAISAAHAIGAITPRSPLGLVVALLL